MQRILICSKKEERMKNKKIIFTLFGLMVIAQLFVPAKMILDREFTIKSGRAFKFKTQPMDPSDPLRGKYVFLNFQDRKVVVDNIDDWNSRELVYVIMKEDSEGFAVIESAHKDKPKDTPDYIKCTVQSTYNSNSENVLTIKYPFDRYYTEESKSLITESIMQENRSNGDEESYAVVSVKNGQAVMTDLRIGDKSVKDIIDLQRETED